MAAKTATTMNDSIQSIANALTESGSIVVISHISPDGDTLGSASALAMALEKLGKKVRITCEGKVPYMLRMLPLKERFESEPSVDEPYTAVSVDCGDVMRMGKLYPLFIAGKKRINIDHHTTNSGFGDLNCVDPTAPATICLVWELIRALGVQADKNMGLAAYIALSTDTGNFNYSNTTPQAFRLAAELLETGFDLSEVAHSLFRERTAARAKVIGLCAKRMQLFGNDTIAVSGVELSDMQRIGASDADCEGAADFLRDIDTVEASAFLREVEPGVFKVSLRSQKYLDVSKVAQRFAGGGHKHAAGAKVNGTLNEAIAAIKDALLQEASEDN